MRTRPGREFRPEPARGNQIGFFEVAVTQAQRHGYWCTYKGGFLTMEEVGRLQGFPSDMIPWASLGISPRQFGATMGNSMTLTVLLTPIPVVLHSAGKIGATQAAVLKHRAARFDVLKKTR